MHPSIFLIILHFLNVVSGDGTSLLLFNYCIDGEIWLLPLNSLLGRRLFTKGLPGITWDKQSKVSLMRIFERESLSLLRPVTTRKTLRYSNAMIREKEIHADWTCYIFISTGNESRRFKTARFRVCNEIYYIFLFCPYGGFPPDEAGNLLIPIFLIA